MPERNSTLQENSVIWTLAGSAADFGRYFQISSAVKTRIGAATRMSALLIL